MALRPRAGTGKLVKAKINVIFYREVEDEAEASDAMLRLGSELRDAGFMPAGADCKCEPPCVGHSFKRCGPPSLNVEQCEFCGQIRAAQ